MTAAGELYGADLPRFKVADEQAGVFVGDTATQPIRKHAAAAQEHAAAPSPQFPGAAGVVTWLDSRWWQWNGTTWTPIARAAASMTWGPPLPLSPELGAFVLAQLQASRAEPLAMALSDGGLYLLTAERRKPVLRAASTPPASLPELAPPPVPETVQPYEGVADSMRKVAEQVAADFRRRRVVEDAHRVVREANLPGPRGRPDREAIIWALFADQAKRTTFHDDPHNTELIGSTEAILCLDPDGACLAGGDCDDQMVALLSRAMALGIVCRLRARRYAKRKLWHVVAEYDVTRNGPSKWKAIDPSVENGHASEAPYLEEMFQTIDTSPAFVGLGDPPGDGDAMLGQTPTTSTTQMDPGNAAAWITLLTNVKAAFDESLSDLQTVATAYASLRVTMGLPVTDDASGAVTPPAGETPTTSSTPLADYATSVANGSPSWTTAAQTAETNLITACTFLSQAMADGLDGARVLTFDGTGAIEGGKPDLFIAAAAGDPYSVLLVKNATTGQWSPQYITPQTSTPATPATLGAAWEFIVGAAAFAVVSVATAWAVHHYMDYLRAAHNDDMLQKVTAQQNQLIASGQMTPAQALQQTQALGTTAAAMNPPEPPTSSNIATIAQWLGVAALGVAAIYGTRAILAATAAKANEPRPRLAGARTARQPRGSALGWERRREREERTTQNIDPELLPLWRAIGGQFRGTPHERFERFSEYAETDEGQRASLEAIEEESAGELDELLEERGAVGCVCRDEDKPRCCGPGCCSWHKGIARTRGGKKRRAA